MKTPNSVFTFGDSNSQLTSPEDLRESVALNDSEEEEESVSNRSRTLSSLKSQLAQAIEDANHSQKIAESLKDELEETKTRTSILTSAFDAIVYVELKFDVHFD